jgi:hypothetical protein
VDFFSDILSRFYFENVLCSVFVMLVIKQQHSALLCLLKDINALSLYLCVSTSLYVFCVIYSEVLSVFM